MRILSSIISSIWNTVTFMDKEQRALVAHVLTVSQAHPKSFNYRNQTGLWESKGLKITFDKAHNEVFLSEVKYKLGWRANAILARHFAMLHICLHHEHIGKALSDIDRVENTHAENEPKKKVNMYDNQQTVGDIKPIEKQPAEISAIDLSKFKGKMVVISRRDGVRIEGEVRVLSDGRFHILNHIYLLGGNVWAGGKPASKMDIVKIELAPQPEPIDLAKYVGKNCYVEMSNGDKGNCYVNYLQTEDAVLLLDSQLLFNRYGKHVYGYDLHVTFIRELEGSFRDCIKTDDVIKPVDNFESLDLSGWTTDIDLTKWIGKTVDVMRRDGKVRLDMVIGEWGDDVFPVTVGGTPHGSGGRYYSHPDCQDGRDVVAIRLNT